MFSVVYDFRSHLGPNIGWVGVYGCMCGCKRWATEHSRDILHPKNNGNPLVKLMSIASSADILRPTILRHQAMPKLILYFIYNPETTKLCNFKYGTGILRDMYVGIYIYLDILTNM